MDGGRDEVRPRPCNGLIGRRSGSSLPLEACAQALAKQRKQGVSSESCQAVEAVCASYICSPSLGQLKQSLGMCSEPQ